MRYFIIFLNMTDSHQSGFMNYGIISKTYPSQKRFIEQVAGLTNYEAKTLVITNIIEVTKEDYDSFFSEGVEQTIEAQNEL